MRLRDLPAVGRLQQAAFPYDAWTEAGLRDELALGAGRWWVVAETGRVAPADLAPADLAAADLAAVDLAAVDLAAVDLAAAALAAAALAAAALAAAALAAADLAAPADAGPANGTGPRPGPGGLVGVAGMALGPVCDVLSLAVAPAARRRGIGRALLAELLTQAWSAGAERVLLEVAADSEAALALYAAAGFDTLRRRVGYYAGPKGPGSVDALVLARAWPGRGVRA